VGDFEITNIPEGEGVLIFNPPYGERLGDPAKLKPLYGKIGDYMKKYGAGKSGYVFSSNLDLMKSIGLKPKRKFPFLNGSLECKLYEYELYAGSRKSTVP
jgi:putative N6-adenine-specific DNA methylase